MYKKISSFILALIILLNLSTGLVSAEEVADAVSVVADTISEMNEDDIENATEDETETLSDEESIRIAEQEEQAKVDGILSVKSKYSDFTDEEKRMFNWHYAVEELSMLECENAGYNIMDSVDVSHIIESIGFNIDDAKLFISKYSCIEEAKYETEQFVNYSNSYEFMNEEKMNKCVALLLNGDRPRNIFLALIASDILCIDVTASIQSVGENYTNEQLSGMYTSVDLDTISDMAEMFYITKSAIADYVLNSGKTVAEISEIIKEYTNTNGFYRELMNSGIAMLAEDTTVTEDSNAIPDAPFNYNKNNGENIDIATGALTYRNTAVVLPGINGLDLDISVKYNSLSASEREMNYQTSPTGGSMVVANVFNPKKIIGSTSNILGEFAYGWSFNFSRIVNITQNGVMHQYLCLANGGMYRIGDDNNGVYDLIEYNLRDIKLKNYGQNKKIIHKDGREEELNPNGRLIKISDRYKNKIEFEYSGYNKVTITDSYGREVVITGDSNKLTIKLPDNSSVVYTIENGVVTNICDRAENNISFDYEIEETTFTFKNYIPIDDGINYYHNLSQITYPTGLKSVFTYETKGSQIQRCQVVDKYNTVNGTDKFNHVEYNDRSAYPYNEATVHVQTDYNLTTYKMNGNYVPTLVISEIDVNENNSDKSGKITYRDEYSYFHKNLPKEHTRTVRYKKDIDSSSVKYVISESKSYNVYGDMESITNFNGEKQNILMIRLTIIIF